MSKLVSSGDHFAGVVRYTDRTDVPDDLHTENEWWSRYRKLKKTVVPRAGLKDRESEFYYHRLYALDDTRSLSKTEKAREYLWRLFVASHNDSRHIKYVEADDDWITVNENSRLMRFEAPHLRRGDLEAHFAHRKVFGLFGGRWTRWIAIDLDMHDRKSTPLTPERKALFTEMLAVLLHNFHGEGWHGQVKDHDAAGVHLLQVLDQPAKLATEVLLLRDRLRRLDERHPDLAARAAALNMKSFGGVEVYPDCKNGFRLPLAKGRTLLLDRPLPAVKNTRGRIVGDVIGYANWLGNPHRQYMPAEDVYFHVVERLMSPPNRPASPAAVAQADPAQSTVATKPARIKNTPDALPPMKGQFRRHLVEFWTGVVTPGGVLNTWIKMLARCLKYEVDEDGAVEVIERYCDELPDKSVSSRLTNDRREVTRYIAAVVRAVYRGDGYQPEPEASAEKMQKTVAAWHAKGFFVADKSTWGTGGATACKVAFEWSAQEVAAIEQYVLPILNIKVRDGASAKSRPPRDPAAELQIACGLVREIVQTVYQYRHREIAYTLLNTIIKRHGVALGSGMLKRTKLMDMLVAMGWISVRTGPWPRKRATGYQIGSKLLYKYPTHQGGERASISSTTFSHPASPPPHLPEEKHLLA